MSEFTQFTIPDSIYDIAESLSSEGWFDSASQAGVFALAYTIRKHFDDIDPSSLKYPGGGHNYNYNTFDPDRSWEEVISNLYNTDTPRTYFKNMMMWGLEDIGKHIQETGLFQISDFI